MKEITLDELLGQMKEALISKESAERARVKAEFKRKKAQYNYLHLMDIFRNKEYKII